MRASVESEVFVLQVRAVRVVPHMQPGAHAGEDSVIECNVYENIESKARVLQ